MIPLWRERWVERENARRTAAYTAVLNLWQHEDANLRAARAAAGEQGARFDPILAGHQQRRPVPPPRAEPHLAPGTAWWTPVRITWVSVIGGLALLCLCGNFLDRALN
jgi:hypothetical protein